MAVDGAIPPRLLLLLPGRRGRVEIQLDFQPLRLTIFSLLVAYPGQVRHVGFMLDAPAHVHAKHQEL